MSLSNQRVSLKRLAPNAGNERQPSGRLSPSTETGGGCTAQRERPSDRPSKDLPQGRAERCRRENGSRPSGGHGDTSRDRTAGYPNRPLADPGVRNSRTGLFKETRFRNQLLRSGICFYYSWFQNPKMFYHLFKSFPRIAFSLASSVHPFV